MAKDQTEEVFDPVAMGLTADGYPGEIERDDTDYFDPLDFARPSFEAAKERFMDAGKIETDPDDPALFNAFKRSMDYLADTGMAGLELSDAAFKAAVGTVAELVPGQGQEAEKRLERDLYSMPEAFMGTSPARLQQSTDTVVKGVKPVKQTAFNTKLYSEEDFNDDLVNVGGMLVDPSFNYKVPDTLEEALSLKTKDFKESVELYPEDSITGGKAKQKLEALEKLGDSFFLNAAESIPHYNDQMYGEYLDRIKNFSKENNLNPEAVLELVQDLDGDFQSIYGQKIDPVLRDVATRVLPDNQPIGERASDWWYLEGSPQRPSDKKALDLNFTDTVYHSSIAPREFTTFNLDKPFVEGSVRASQDLLGVHVGTARAAAERNLDAVRNLDEPTGFTMELRARTDKPFTKAEAKKLFKNYSPKDDNLFLEEDLNKLIGVQAEELFDINKEPLPDNYRNLAAIELRKKLAQKGYTHIPYLNDVEDPGSTSFIMLVDRPKDSPAVLRDVRAKFDPEKATDPDLRFAEGGSVEKQMNKMYQEGGLQDDGTDIEPVTGNEVPTGSLDQEVRDDIPAQLSEGEYVVPADVVRYYGVKFFEDLRGKAKQAFARMEAEGRVGGEPVSPEGIPMEQEEELTPEEMQMLAEALGQAPQQVPTGMAMGGMVPQQQVYNPYEQQQMQYSQPMFQSTRGMAVGGAVQGVTQGIDSAAQNTGTTVYVNPTTGQTLILPTGFQPPAGFQKQGEETQENLTPQIDPLKKMEDEDEGGRGPEGHDDAAPTAEMPTVQDMVDMTEAELGQTIDQHNEAASVMGAFGLGPIGMAMKGVNSVMSSRVDKAKSKRSELGIPNPNVSVSPMGKTGPKGAVQTVVNEVAEALGLTSEDESTAEAATEATAEAAEATGPDSSSAGESDSGADSGSGGEGGEGNGEGEGESGFAPGGLATKKKTKQNKTYKNNNKKRRGLGSK